MPDEQRPRGPDEWAVPGAETVVVAGRADEHVDVTRVERVGKRDVVTESGERFNREHLTSDGYGLRRHGARTWDPPISLYPPDAPPAQRALVRQRHATARRRALDLIGAWTPDDDGPARRAHELLGRHLAPEPSAGFGHEPPDGGGAHGPV